MLWIFSSTQLQPTPPPSLPPFSQNNAMLKLVNSNFRDLPRSLNLTTPFKPPAFLPFFSHFHTPGDGSGESSKLASLLSGREVEEEPRSPSFRGLERPVQLGGDGGVCVEDERGGSNSDMDMNPSGERGASRFSHPWAEWVGFMDLLVKLGHFHEIGKPFGNEEAGFGAKDSNLVRTACLNFGRSGIDLIRHLSRKDIRAMTELGCPSLDRKVVNSGKRLRAYVGVDERNTCSSCSLRGSCDRENVKVRVDEVARTVDVMRILLTFGLNHTTSSVENTECQNHAVQESVRRLLKEILVFCQKEPDPNTHAEGNFGGGSHSGAQGEGQIRLPTKRGEWICPKCAFLNFARNIKCLRCNELSQDRLRKITEDQAQLPLKKGDWFCEKCKFLNFAKNAKCLLCEAKPPKRQLGPGEWECDSCNYINFRKNQLCLRCDHKRPKASASSDTSAELNGKISDPEDGMKTISETKRNPRQRDSWQFVDEQKENRAVISERKVLEFVDFPVLGGKSRLSQSEEDIEKWKSKMRETLRRSRKARGGSNKVEYPEFLSCTDDEEIEEWFGQGKNCAVPKQV